MRHQMPLQCSFAHPEFSGDARSPRVRHRRADRAPDSCYEVSPDAAIDLLELEPGRATSGHSDYPIVPRRLPGGSLLHDERPEQPCGVHDDVLLG